MAASQPLSRSAFYRANARYLSDALADPEHPEHEDKVDWIGGDFDPEAFDLDEVNTVLRRIR